MPLLHAGGPSLLKYLWLTRGCVTGLADSIAVACDDGCLRLFGVEEGEPGLSYQSTLPHLGGRLLSVAWHPKGRVAVVGTSQGTLHAWDTTSKREVLRIQTGEYEAHLLLANECERSPSAGKAIHAGGFILGK